MLSRLSNAYLILRSLGRTNLFLRLVTLPISTISKCRLRPRILFTHTVVFPLHMYFFLPVDPPDFALKCCRKPFRVGASSLLTTMVTLTSIAHLSENCWNQVTIFQKGFVLGPTDQKPQGWRTPPKSLWCVVTASLLPLPVEGRGRMEAIPLLLVQLQTRTPGK